MHPIKKDKFKFIEEGATDYITANVIKEMNFITLAYSLANEILKSIGGK